MMKPPLFSKSDFIYIVLMNAILKEDSIDEKYEFMRRMFYRKGADYNEIKLIISATAPKDNESEYDYFMRLIGKLSKFMTMHKRKEIEHIVELKYGRYSK